MTRLGWIAGLGLWVGCATAPSPSPATKPQASQPLKSTSATASAKNDKSKLICEDIKVTGTRIPKRVCRTAEQARAEREQAEKALQEGDRVNREWGN